jgi:hypothetical protein
MCFRICFVVFLDPSLSIEATSELMGRACWLGLGAGCYVLFNRQVQVFHTSRKALAPGICFVAIPHPASRIPYPESFMSLRYL